MLSAEFKNLLCTDQIKIMMKRRVLPRIMHDVQVNNGINLFASKHVFKTTSSNIGALD